jgi:hypothetical protein
MKDIVKTLPQGYSRREPDESQIIRPAVGSPYYIAEDGLPVFLSPPGTPVVTSEDVRRELEDFP